MVKTRSLLVMERARHFIELASVPQAAKIDVLRELTAAIEAEYEDAKHDKSAAARLTGERDAARKLGYKEGLEQGIFDGKMDRLRAETAEAALSQAQQALHSIAEMNCGCSTLAKQILGLPSDTPGAQAQENELCAACHHVKNDSTMHHDAPGTNWGAALHWFQAQERELK
jgi:hypothetical protein